MAKALLVIAPSNFRDEELFHTKEELEKAGVSTLIASKKKGLIVGMLGGEATSEMVLSEVVVDSFDAVVFVGGSGAREYYSDSEALGIARKSFESGKVLAAICIAPGILAEAGLLDGKKATIWNGDGAHSKVLSDGGAEYTGDDLTVDGRIITANGPSAARAFGKRIAEEVME